MKYCITMEQTRRIAVYFEADAEVKAIQINRSTSSEDFESGDEERDYALYNQDTGQTIVEWD